MAEYNNNDIGRELGWDDTIKNDSTGFELVPEGDYRFTVTKFERGRHPGSDKLPPCNKAELYMRIEDDAGHVSVVQHNLFLHSKTEGMLCAFFTAIGQRKHGEELRMNWGTVVGSTGTCKVGIRTWKGRDGDERQSNQITRFYEADNKPDFKAGEF